MHLPKCFLMVSVVTATVFLQAGPRAACGADAASAGVPWRVLVVGEQTQPERLATLDLERYLTQVIARTPGLGNNPAQALVRRISVAQWTADPVAALVIGTPGGNALLADAPARAEDLGQQGYWVGNAQLRDTPVAIAMGATAEGAVHAVYALLRELGFRFYMGSESVPDTLPAKLSATRTAKPVFAVRGVLPWYNFFNSPTTWDPIDHRTFVDQLIRTGANFVGFHTYDYEPFAAYEEAGRMKWGSRLLSTSSPTWGTKPLSTAQFAFGTDQCFASPYFGASTTLLADDDEAIRVEQRILRDALDYAHARGLKTCLGFEVNDDPTQEATRDIFLKRLNHLLDTYPSLDYLWIWQPEAQGALGFRKPYRFPVDETSHLSAYAQMRREAFHRIVEGASGEKPFFQDNNDGMVARALEAVRLEHFAQLALRAFAHRSRAPRLVISGWGGDERLVSAEYYDGLDKLLPKSVAFASLDHIIPRTRVDAIYHQLPSDRERWPIPWLEYDGDQWHPQPYVHVYEKMVRDAHQGGSQGMLGIHWRTRDIEENFSYMVDYAWNPQLTAAEFFKDLAKHCYPAEIAEQMAEIHIGLDQLGYRWIGGGGQGECGPFGWGPGEPRKVEELAAFRKRVADLLPRVSQRKSQERHRLQWLLAEMDWVLAFDRAQTAAVAARELLVTAQHSSPDEAKRLAEQALAQLDNGAMQEALRHFARRVTTRGEYGVLATINTKAVAAWRQLREQAARELKRELPPESSSPWQPEPGIVVPRLMGSVPQGQDLAIEVVALGGGPSWAHYRRVGATQWNTVEMTAAQGWVRAVTIPAAQIQPPGIEVGFSTQSRDDNNMQWGPHGITVMPAAIEPPSAKTKSPVVAPPESFPVERGTAPDAPVLLTWSNVPGADFFRVYRDDRLVTETAVSSFPDTPMKKSTRYRVEAVGGGSVVAASPIIECPVPDQAIASGPAELRAEEGRRSVILRWQPSLAGAVVFRVRRHAEGQSPDTSKLLAELPAGFPATDMYKDRPGPGGWVYQVSGVNAAGREGPASVTAPITIEPPTSVQPVLDWPLTTQPPDAVVTGGLRFGNDGARFLGGFLRLPHRDELDMADAFSLEFEFFVDQLDSGSMPVLICHGAYAIDGWFVQILNGSLIFRTTGGDAQGPPISTGQWYKVRLIYDGMDFDLQVNGQNIPQPVAPGPMKPASSDLFVGQYSTPAASYTFFGVIRHLKIYNDIAAD